jgi:acyl-coenzyme A thioesterase PaaI-like protein
MRKLPPTKSCFVCGRLNPLGLRLEFETDGQRVQTTFQFRPEHVGYSATIHGGLIATLLDEVMCWVCGVRLQRFGYSVELQVRFRRPARPGEPLTVTGELLANRRGRLFETRAELRDASGAVLATGQGKYMPVDDTTAAALQDELLGDVRDLFGEG